MSQLKLIKDALSKHSEISFVNEHIFPHSQTEESHGWWLDIVKLYYGLRSPSYSVDRLNAVMLGCQVISDDVTLECDRGDLFTSYRDDRGIHFGHLHYDEVVGHGHFKKEINLVTTITDPDVPDREGYVNRVETTKDTVDKKYDLSRRILIYIYPSIEVAQRAFDCKGDLYWLKENEIPKQVW